MHSREFWVSETHSRKWYFGVALSGGAVLSEAVGAAKLSVALLRRLRGRFGFHPGASSHVVQTAGRYCEG